YLPPVPLLAAFVLDHIRCFPLDNDPQTLPKTVSIRKSRKPPLLDSPAKTIKRAQGHVFLVRRASGSGLKPPARQPSQTPKTSLPQFLDRLAISSLQAVAPIRDRSFRRPTLPPSSAPEMSG